MSAAAKSTPAEAVHLEVDETRRCDSAAVAARNPAAHDPAVGDLDVAGHELPVDQRGFDAEPHRASIAWRTSSFAREAARAPSARRRLRAARRSRPRVPVRRLERLVCPLRRRTGGEPHDPRTRARSLSFVAATSTIRFPKVLPRRTIATVEIVLSTSFCAVRPSAGRAGDHLRADDDGDLALGELAERGLLDCRDGHGMRAGGARARSAPITYGVRPLALIPTTTSRSPGASAIRSSSPAASSSSAASCSAPEPPPPATIATTGRRHRERRLALVGVDGRAGRTSLRRRR